MKLIAIFLGFVFATTACSRRALDEPVPAKTSEPSVLAEQGLDIVPPYDDSAFGLAIALSNDLALVGSPNALVDETPSGAVFTYTHVGSGWVHDALPIVPPNAQADQRFGTTIACAGNRAVIAARTPEAQAVWSFPRGDGAWGSPEDALTASTATPLDPPLDASEDTAFGAALAMDSTTLLVGAFKARQNAGVVYVYRRTKTGWQPVQAFQPESDFSVSANFGISVALDGDRAVIGASGERGGLGGIYALERTSPSEPWSMTRVALAPEAESAPSFGSTLALAGDTLVVGAPYSNDVRGTVFVFKRASNEWTYDRSLSRTGLQPYDAFGSAVAMSDSHLFVGVPGALVDQITSGRIYAYARGSWVPARGRDLVPQQHAADAGVFGASLAVSPGGTVITTGLPFVYAYSAELGQSCESGLDCDSGHCSDGVCCEEACTAGCYSCLGANTQGGHGTDGKCLAVDAGKNPRQECDATLSSNPCGTTGACDGQGSCATVEVGTVCADAYCDSTTAAVGSGTCNDHQRCVSPAPLSCDAGYACNEGSGACLVQCATDGDCDREHGFICVENACVSGGECVRNADCASGHCSDGACCEEACEGSCVSCLASRTGLKRNGLCGPVHEGTNPRGACEANGGPCGNTGLCDGAGSCALAAQGTTCSAVGCDSRTTRVEPGTCDGDGDCVLPDPVACPAGQVCHSGACTRTCALNSDCVETSGYYCLDGACVSGRSCTDANTTEVDERGVPTHCPFAVCREGSCLQMCRRSDEDCQEGAACHPTRHVCVPASALPAPHARGGCSLASVGGSRDWSFVFLGAAALWLTRRRCGSKLGWGKTRT